MTRCFVALELDESSRAYLHDYARPVHAALQPRHRWPMRLVKPENWHLTVLFFPDLSESERIQVWSALAPTVPAGAWNDPRFAWQGLSLWPTARRPSLVALEAETYLPAQTWPIAALLDQEPFSRGDSRHFSPFRPHITVMRFDPRWRRVIAEDWAEVTRDLEPFNPARIRFVALSLVLSTLTPEQPVYERERWLEIT
jgi:2'-5' RNA ligase